MAGRLGRMCIAKICYDNDDDVAAVLQRGAFFFTASSYCYCAFLASSGGCCNDSVTMRCYTFGVPMNCLHGALFATAPWCASRLYGCVHCKLLIVQNEWLAWAGRLYKIQPRYKDWTKKNLQNDDEVKGKWWNKGQSVGADDAVKRVRKEMSLAL